MRGFILLAIVAVASARPEAGYSYRAPGGHSGGHVGHVGHAVSGGGASIGHGGGHSSHGSFGGSSSFGGGSSFGGSSSFGTSGAAHGGSGRFQQFAFNKWVKFLIKMKSDKTNGQYSNKKHSDYSLKYPKW